MFMHVSMVYLTHLIVYVDGVFYMFQISWVFFSGFSKMIEMCF